MTKKEFAKACIGLVVGGTTALVVKEIIKNNTNPAKVSDKAAILIASYVLGAIAADAASKWSDRKIDEYIAKWTKAVNEYNDRTV